VPVDRIGRARTDRPHAEADAERSDADVLGEDLGREHGAGVEELRAPAGDVGHGRADAAGREARPPRPHPRIEVGGREDVAGGELGDEVAVGPAGDVLQQQAEPVEVGVRVRRLGAGLGEQRRLQ
jgi:hypothetical protein